MWFPEDLEDTPFKLHIMVTSALLQFKKYEKDTILKHVFLTNKGNQIFNEIFFAQKKRIYKALINSSSVEINNFNNVLKKIINE